MPHLPHGDQWEGKIFGTVPRGFLDSAPCFIGDQLARLVQTHLLETFRELREEFRYNRTHFFVQGMVYEVRYVQAYARRPGEGGEFQQAYVLSKNERPLLLTRRLKSWESTSDDSEDYGFPDDNHTYLLVEERVARSIFEKAKHFAAASGRASSVQPGRT